MSAETGKRESESTRTPSSEQEDHNLIFDYSDKKKEKNHIPSSGKQSTDKMLIGGIVFLLVLFAAFMGFIYWKQHQRPLTIEELHILNLKGELDSNEGYVYNTAYSFINYEGQWYTALASQSGDVHYNFAFRYSPKDVEDLQVVGELDEALFNSVAEYYITFNPLADNLSNTVLAVNDFNQHMINTFKKLPIAACDRNETEACALRPIVTCDTADPSQVVVHIQQSSIAGVELDGNCIILKGEGLGQVEAVDRLLYQFYNIMS
jgi:hypothetical protein